MNYIRYAFCLTVLAISPLLAEEPTAADQKWAKAVEQKIAAGPGPTTISTPSETRAKLAESVARKLGRQVKLAKHETGFTVEVRTTEVTEK